MKLTEIDKQFKNVAGILGFIQGLVWFFMSIMCISLFESNDPKKFYPADHYIDNIARLIRYVFLKKINDIPYDRRFVTPTFFMVFTWLYFILDLIWLIVSAWLIQAKKETIIEVLLKAWAYVTSLISVLDLFVTILLGVQYDNCLDSRKNFESFCANAILPVLVIAAKGFVLWIVNVVFAIILIKITRRVNAEIGTVFQNNPEFSFQVPQPVFNHESHYASPTLPPLNFQNWENNNYNYSQQHLPTPTQAPSSLPTLNQDQFRHALRSVSPTVSNRDRSGQYSSTQAPSSLPTSNQDQFRHVPRSVSPTVPNRDRSGQYSSTHPDSHVTANNFNRDRLRSHPVPPMGFISNNRLQNENRFRYSMEVPQSDNNNNNQHVLRY